MNYNDYIDYHLGGDAGVEERMIASLCKYFKLDEWNAFRLIYFYTMTYHIPSALSMLEGERDMAKLKFRTDRRYVRCNGAYPRLLQELTTEKLTQLKSVKTTSEAYWLVSSWYFFGRYAAYLFLEVYMNVFSPEWIDNLIPEWEPSENYTKGAVSVALSEERVELNKFLERTKKDTRDNVFAIETSLCAIEKFRKGTRWNGFYTERLLSDIRGCKWENLIIRLL